MIGLVVVVAGGEGIGHRKQKTRRQVHLAAVRTHAEEATTILWLTFGVLIIRARGGR